MRRARDHPVLGPAGLSFFWIRLYRAEEVGSGGGGCDDAKTGRPAKACTTAITLAAVAALGALVMGQTTQKPMSPEGVAQAQVLGTWAKGARPAFTLGRETYQNGKWIEISCGRPLQRGRDLFGSGENYGKAALDVGAPGFPPPPVWRAGANMTTRLKTEATLSFGGEDRAGRIRPVRRSQAEGTDVIIDVGGAGQVRSAGQVGAVGRLRLHARQGHNRIVKVERCHSTSTSSPGAFST